MVERINLGFRSPQKSPSATWTLKSVVVLSFPAMKKKVSWSRSTRVCKKTPSKKECERMMWKKRRHWGRPSSFQVISQSQGLTPPQFSMGLFLIFRLTFLITSFNNVMLGFSENDQHDSGGPSFPCTTFPKKTKSQSPGYWVQSFCSFWAQGLWLLHPWNYHDNRKTTRWRCISY